MSQERIPLRQQRDLSQIIESSFELYTQNFAALFLIAQPCYRSVRRH